jgi:hypothetical protein
MKEIPLTKGRVATVDDEDYVRFCKEKWHIGHEGRTGYAVRMSSMKGGNKQRTIYMHREIWKSHYGAIPENMEIDHIDGDRLNNQVANLRLCTHSQNCQNQYRTHLTHSSKFKGVTWFKANKRWGAQINNKGHLTHLGLFDTEEEAALAYNRKAIEWFGEYANINRVEGIYG